MESQERRRFLLVFLIVGMVLANIVLIYLIMQNKNSEIAGKELIIAQQKKDYEKDLKDLQDKLEDQIRSAKKLGDENRVFVDSLQKVLKSIDADRENLKKANQISQGQARQYKEKIEAYEMLLRQKDKEIDKLRETAEILYKENNTLKEEKNQLSSTISEKNQDLDKLKTKVDAAAILKAENVNVNIINSKGKEESGGEYRAKRIEKLAISFNVADNKLAKIGNKDVYMRVVEPAGTVLSNPGSSGNFDLDGRQATYSARQQILFDNSRQKVNFQFSRTGEFQAGRHTVEFYCDGQRIGVGSFEVR